MKTMLTLFLIAAPVTAQTHTLVSTRADGSQIQADSQPAGGSGNPLSANGRYFVFFSRGTDIVPNTPTPEGGLFLKDLKTGGVELVVAKEPWPVSLWFGGISADGRQVLYETPNGSPQIFVHSMDTGLDECVTVNDAGQTSLGGAQATMSADGRFVAFEGGDWILSPDWQYSGWASIEIYLRDRVAGTTVRISGPEWGNYSYGPVVSADGSTVAYMKLSPESGSPNAPIAYGVNIWDTAVGFLSGIPTPGYDGQVTSISANGRRVVFVTVDYDDSSRVTDYVFDRDSGVISDICIDAEGQPTWSSNWPWGHISADGRFVQFSSDADGIIPGDANGNGEAYLRDLSTQSTALLFGPGIYGLPKDDQLFPIASAGPYPLIPRDTNGFADAYLFDRTPLPPSARPNGQTRMPGGHKYP